MVYKNIYIYWDSKHNTGFKSYLKFINEKQYWNTNCINCENNNYYFFSNMKKDTTENRCQSLINGFEKYAQSKIDTFYKLKYSTKQIQSFFDDLWGAK